MYNEDRIYIEYHIHNADNIYKIYSVNDVVCEDIVDYEDN